MLTCVCFALSVWTSLSFKPDQDVETEDLDYSFIERTFYVDFLLSPKEKNDSYCGNKATEDDQSR